MSAALAILVPNEAYSPRISQNVGVLRLDFPAIPIDVRVIVHKKLDSTKEDKLFQLKLTFTSLKDVTVQVQYKEEDYLTVHHHLDKAVLYLTLVANPVTLPGYFQKVSGDLIQIQDKPSELRN